MTKKEKRNKLNDYGKKDKILMKGKFYIGGNLDEGEKENLLGDSSYIFS